MVARLVRDPFDREGWFFELNWDGFRAIAETDGAGLVSLYSRNHSEFNTRFRSIADTLVGMTSSGWRRVIHPRTSRTRASWLYRCLKSQFRNFLVANVVQTSLQRPGQRSATDAKGRG